MAGPSLGGLDGEYQGEYQGEYRITRLGGIAADLVVPPSIDDRTVTPEPTTVGLLRVGLLAVRLVGVGVGMRRQWRARRTRTRSARRGGGSRRRIAARRGAHAFARASPTRSVARASQVVMPSQART